MVLTSMCGCYLGATAPAASVCLYDFATTDSRSLPTAQAVSYVAPSPAQQVVLESGTRSPDALPRALYGCPYPPSSGGACQPPPSCNCYNVSEPCLASAFSTS
jgi:hypothetical protein